jgi:uncharacterized OB-fold protein
MSAPEMSLQLAHCSACGAHTFPATAYGCRRCGRSDALQPVALPQAPRLLNFVTVHAELAPGLAVPCVFGEVELAPGVVEEAPIAVDDERALALDMPLRAVAVLQEGRTAWRFAPVEAAEARP